MHVNQDNQALLSDYGCEQIKVQLLLLWNIYIFIFFYLLIEDLTLKNSRLNNNIIVNVINK